MQTCANLQNVLLDPIIKQLYFARGPIETFKVIYGHSPVYLQNFVSLKASNYNFRYANLLDSPRVKSTRYGTNSFSFQAAKLWNALPEEAKINSFTDLKHFIKCWNGVYCKYTMC